MSEKISILFAGDFCASNPSQIEVSDELKYLFDSADVKVLNFEGPLATEHFASPNKTVLKQSDESPKWCERNGFDIVSLANNHLLDYGQDGCRKTIDSFQNSSVIGAGSWEESYRVHYIDIKNKRIGFFSASSADLASLQDRWTESGHLGAAWINHSSVNGIIQNAKKVCDYLFVMVHAGVEYMTVPLPEWRDRYKELIDLGADAVIAAHPHIVQGWEECKGHPIFYSLGNFYFDYFNEYGKPENWDKGLVAVLTVGADGNIESTAIPTIKTDNRIECDHSLEREEYNDKLCDLLSDNGIYMKRVNEYCLRFFDRYKDWLLTGFGAQEYNSPFVRTLLRFIKHLIRRDKASYRIALHQIREESTRYLLIRALRLK